MAKNIKNPKATDVFLPKVDPQSLSDDILLPYNRNLVNEKSFSFSFAYFDRTHPLFNLGDRSQENGIVSSTWFLDFLDCLKSVNGMSVTEVRASLHDMHPVDWSKANVAAPAESSQAEYWQFRINKSKGRVIGILLSGIFYVVWLDPHHNLTDSPHYGRATYQPAPRSQFEIQEAKIAELENEVGYWKEEYRAAQDLLNE